MAIRLESQAQMRQIRSLPFCYVCAQAFEPHEERNSDHVPPTALFATDHRDFPLILPTHTRCNSAQSADDETIGQLVGVLHGRAIVPHGRKPELYGGVFPDGSPGAGAKGLDVKRIIWRWVRGFHAALYRSPILEVGRQVFPPLPEGRVEAGRVEPVPVPEVIQHFVQEIKRNRATGTLDSVVCRKARCRYECVWTQADGGQWFCVWALDIYGWSELGHDPHFDRRGCVGMYRQTDPVVPPGAEVATRLHFSVGRGLDPFAGS